ncbi:hypothetical protein P4O66_004302 [Electrophorus voltai]|uniref:Uncharacterized protein n=1 Tax=Electrophorus voltai TaxID=2609070 RepID=A0AAD9E588_9TELE|nr:hypothetical protein P4O66_004302 [Electrophorus voltai]
MKFPAAPESTRAKAHSTRPLHDIWTGILNMGQEEEQLTLLLPPPLRCTLAASSCLGSSGVSVHKHVNLQKQISPAQCSAVAYLRLQSQYVRNEWNLNKYDTSEEGYRRLISAVTNCRKARLTGCLVTEEGCSSLVSALRSNYSHLKELDLTYNHPGESGWVELCRPEGEATVFLPDWLARAPHHDDHDAFDTVNLNILLSVLSWYGWLCMVSSLSGGMVLSDACELTLDPNTAHTDLALFERNRKSSDSDTTDFSRTRVRPSLILASLHGITTEEGPAGYYRDQPTYKDRYSEVESTESCMDLTEGYAEYGK